MGGWGWSSERKSRLSPTVKTLGMEWKPNGPAKCFAGSCFVCVKAKLLQQASAESEKSAKRGGGGGGGGWRRSIQKGMC